MSHEHKKIPTPDWVIELFMRRAHEDRFHYLAICVGICVITAIVLFLFLSWKSGG